MAALLFQETGNLFQRLLCLSLFILPLLGPVLVEDSLHVRYSRNIFSFFNTLEGFIRFVKVPLLSLQRFFVNGVQNQGKSIRGTTRQA